MTGLSSTGKILQGLKQLPRVDESWKFTSLRSLCNDYSQARESSPPVESALPLALIPWRVVFYNGRFCPALTVLPEQGCVWQKLAQIKQGHASWSDGFEQLALADAREAYQLEISQNLSQPLGLYHFVDQNFAGAMTHPWLSVVIGREARCQLLQVTCGEGMTSALYNAHNVFTLEPGSQLAHLRVFKLGAGITPLSRVQVGVGSGAHYHDTLLALGGDFLRNQIQVQLLAPTASTEINGLYSHVAREESSHFTHIQHRAPRTKSRQLYKGLLDQHSHASFLGMIGVAANCSQVDSAQLNKNILLSETAQVDSCPQLEISQCDVKCTHGSTTGQLSADELFYLQSRGLSLGLAKGLLTQAFCRDIVTHIPDMGLREQAHGFLGRWGSGL